jgi:hypothetical protein
VPSAAWSDTPVDAASEMIATRFLPSMNARRSLTLSDASRSSPPRASYLGVDLGRRVPQKKKTPEDGLVLAGGAADDAERAPGHLGDAPGAAERVDEGIQRRRRHVEAVQRAEHRRLEVDELLEHERVGPAPLGLGARGLARALPLLDLGPERRARGRRQQAEDRRVVGRRDQEIRVDLLERLGRREEVVDELARRGLGRRDEARRRVAGPLEGGGHDVVQARLARRLQADDDRVARVQRGLGLCPGNPFNFTST